MQLHDWQRRRSIVSRCATAAWKAAMSIVAAALVASCADGPSQPVAELKVNPRIAKIYEGWVCDSTTVNDYTVWNCIFYEGGGWGIPEPPLPPDPDEPPTYGDDCVWVGGCGGLTGPWAGEPVPGEMPPGFPAEQWPKLNDAERKLCSETAKTCAQIGWFALRASLKADSAAATSNTSPYDNIYDAWRHAYWMALVRRHYGVLLTRAWGAAHETTPGSRTQMCMDLHNNKVGEQIAHNNLGATDEHLWHLVITRPSLASH